MRGVIALLFEFVQIFEIDYVLVEVEGKKLHGFGAFGGGERCRWREHFFHERQTDIACEVRIVC